MTSGKFARYVKTGLLGLGVVVLSGLGGVYGLTGDSMEGASFLERTSGVARSVQYKQGVCADPWVTQAVTQVMGRAPQGNGYLGECDIYRYGRGSWSSYNDLVAKVEVAFGLKKLSAAEIEQAYQSAFGRAPAADETRYWLSVPASDARVRSVDTLVANHRNWLKSSAQERDATVRRAFNQVFKHDVTAAQNPWFQEALSEVAANGTPYSTLTRNLAGIAADFAYEKLVGQWPSTSRRNQLINNMANGSWDGDELWRAVARSEERLQGHSFWAPAPSKPGEQIEICFGAIGPKCDGAPKSTPVWVDRFTRPDGEEMAYVDIQVHIGSIMHDNACLRLAPGSSGTWCNGTWKGVITDERPLAKFLQPASLEWNKAVYNTIDDRFWTERFGPYPTDPNRRATYTDDLTQVPNRPAKMAPILGIGALPTMIIDYTGGETRQTLVLKAPPGTALDRSDAAFCRSGSYREEANLWVQKYWIVCN